MGFQQFTQDMSKIPLKNNINVLFYTKYTHPTLICRGTDALTHARTDGQKIFTQYSGISSCSLGSTDNGQRGISRIQESHPPKLHNTTSSTQQSSTQSCRKSNSNVQKPFYSNHRRSRRHVSNATLGQTLTSSNCHTQSSPPIQCSSISIRVPICPRNF